jgi:hypothetical protein
MAVFNDPGLMRLLAQEPRAIPLGDIRTDPRLQARDESLVPSRFRPAYQRESEKQVAMLCATLLASVKVQLTPILLACIDGLLYVIDGHHRIAAYRKAKREAIPAQVAEMTWIEAAITSKAANCLNHSTLAPYAEERKEWAWQYIMHATRGGAIKPRGLTVRKVGDAFKLTRNQTHPLLQAADRFDPTLYGPEACDPLTGFPKWRYVQARRSAWEPQRPLEGDALAAELIKRVWRQIEGQEPMMQRRVIADVLRDIQRGVPDEGDPEPDEF